MIHRALLLEYPHHLLFHPAFAQFVKSLVIPLPLINVEMCRKCVVSVGQDNVAAMEQPSVATASCSPVASEQPASEVGWVRVYRKCSPNQRPVVHDHRAHNHNTHIKISTVPQVEEAKRTVRSQDLFCVNPCLFMV